MTADHGYLSISAPGPRTCLSTPAPRCRSSASDRSVTGARPWTDLIIEDISHLWPLARQINEAPTASATIVQVLRATENLDLQHALVVESIAFAMLQSGPEHADWLARTRRPAALAGKIRIARVEDRLDVTLDRPGALNAIDHSMRDSLFEAFALAAVDLDIKAVRLRAAGRCFSIGADLAEFGTTRISTEAHAIRTRNHARLPHDTARGDFMMCISKAHVSAPAWNSPRSQGG